MTKHFISFIKCPIGYAFNFVAHFEYPQSLTRFVCWGCETFCLQDGVQDNAWF
jgi:hypothetical protein